MGQSVRNERFSVLSGQKNGVHVRIIENSTTLIIMRVNRDIGKVCQLEECPYQIGVRRERFYVYRYSNLTAKLCDLKEL